MCKIKRTRGHRCWDHTDIGQMVELPANLALDNPGHGPRARLRVTTIVASSLFEVVDVNGDAWEVSVAADGILEIVFPDEVSGKTKNKVLKAVRQIIGTN